VKHGAFRSSALHRGRKVLSAALYVDPTFHIDKSISITQTTLAKGKERLERQLAERDRLIAENKRLRAAQGARGRSREKASRGELLIMALSTADCRNWLVKHKADEVQAKWDDLDDPDLEPEEREFIEKICRYARTPSKWKRITKYKVGSKIDMGDEEPANYEGRGGHCYAHQPALLGGVVRQFYLEDTDHITYMLVEVDGQIVYVDDASD